MGQAKRRGNFQTRRKLAIARKQNQLIKDSTIRHLWTAQSTRRSRLKLAALTLATLGIPTSTKPL